MLKQVELFTTVNQMPPIGLTTQKEQAIDPLEGFRRKEEEPQTGDIWQSKTTDLTVAISHITEGLVWYDMAAWNRPQATETQLFMESMKRIGGGE